MRGAMFYIIIFFKSFLSGNLNQNMVAEIDKIYVLDSIDLYMYIARKD